MDCPEYTERRMVLTERILIRWAVDMLLQQVGQATDKEENQL
jgi:hypothetical protein